MASTKITYVTGTAEIKRRDTSQDPHLAMSKPEQHFVTEPSTPLQVTYVDGKCSCCPYGYHIDLDFLNFCNDLETGSTLKNLKRIQRTKRNLRKSMEIMLNEQEGIKADPNSAPPDVVMSTEAERLMHMVNYEQSATVNILRQIDTSVRTDVASFESRTTWKNDASDSYEAKTQDTKIPNSHDGLGYRNPPVVVLSRAESLSSLSSSSTMSSEAALLHQADLIQQQHPLQHSRSVAKVVEQPVLEMATAEMIHYSTTSSAQLADVSVREDQTDANLSTGRKTKQNFLTEVSATYRTSDTDTPREHPDVNETSLQSLRDALAASLQRVKVLEDQVKTIPILQVRISVLKEEKRLLNLQLKARKSSTGPPTTTVGVGEDSIDIIVDKDETMHPPRLFWHTASTTVATSTPKKDLMVKSPPPTLPKPARTSTVAVGNHSVLEPYNLQPHLPSGYTIRENETAFGIYSKTLLERESSTFSNSQEHLLNSSVQQIASYNIPSNDKWPSNTRQAELESNQSNVTVNQIQKSSLEVVTRTIGVGDANVFEDSKLHVHEKELRTVIIGQNNTVAKRNVGIECRVQTRDVGVLFICDEAKPATRTIGVNVNYDTSGVFTSLDFKGERELRVALQGVLHRSVKSVGTSCYMTPTTVEHATMTDLNVGVSVGCGDEEQRVDVEVRPVVARKSVAATCKPDVGHKYVSTDADWAIDASTNTYQVDSYDKGLMTDKVKQVFASTNTGSILKRPASNQTEQQVFISLGQFRHTASNTENIKRHSTGVSTDIIATHNVHVNTVETISDLFDEAFNKKSVDSMMKKQSLQSTKETDSTTLGEMRIETTEQFREGKDTETSAALRTSNATVQEQVTHEHSDRESSFPGKSEYTKKSSRYDYGNTHYSSLEISSRSTPATQSHISSQKSTISGQEDLNNNASILEKAQPDNSDDRFSETVVEHFILTKDGKKLISEEKITTSSAGTNRSFKEYAHNADHTFETHTDSIQRPGSESSTTDGNQTGSWSMTNSSSYNSNQINESSLTDISKINAVGNQYQVAEKLTNVSLVLDSDTLYNNSLSSSENKKSGKTVYYQESGLKLSSKSEPSREIIHNLRRAGSVEDFMPNDIRKYMSINPTVSKDSGLDREPILRLYDDSINSTPSYGGAVILDTNEKKTSRTVTTQKNFKSGGLSPVQEIKTFETSDVQEDSGNELKEVVEEIIEKSEASLCGEQLNMPGRQESSTVSSTTTTKDTSSLLTDRGQMWSSYSSGARDERSINNLTTSGTEISTETVMVAVGESPEMMTGIRTSGSMSQELMTGIHTNESRSQELITGIHTSESRSPELTTGIRTSESRSQEFTTGIHTSESRSQELTTDKRTNESMSQELMTGVHTSESMSQELMTGIRTNESMSQELTTGKRTSESMSQELMTGIRTSGSVNRKPVLKSIMKHTTETQCASTKKAIKFAESVTGGTGSSSDDDSNCSDAESTDSFDEGSYDGQEVEVTYYSKDGRSLRQDSPDVQMLDQNIREIYELSDDAKSACLVLATYLTDSTSIQTKQLNASQETIQHEWFQLSSHKLSSAHKVEDYLSSVNEISNRLLEYIINMTDANGNTAIHYCTSHGNFDIAGLLLDSKVCDTNRRNKAGYTPIMLAGLATIQDQQQYDVIKRLLSLGEVNAQASQTQQTALMLAASHGRTEMVKLLIEEGADVNLQDEDGSTALMCACEHGHLEVVNVLLTHPAIDVNLTDCENSTALSIAMAAGHKDIGVVLYKHLNFSKVSSPGSHKKEKKFQLSLSK